MELALIGASRISLFVVVYSTVSSFLRLFSETLLLLFRLVSSFFVEKKKKNNGSANSVEQGRKTVGGGCGWLCAEERGTEVGKYPVEALARDR